MSGAKKPWRQEMPDFLQFLESPWATRSGCTKRCSGTTSISRTLSDWKLRFSDRTPFIWVKAADMDVLPPPSWPKAWRTSCGATRPGRA